MVDEAKTKFVVLTTNRSGSVWVMSTLNSVPGVTAHGELFLPRRRSSETRWDSNHARPRYIEMRRAGGAVRPITVFSYLDDLYKTAGAVGFKLMYAQLGRYPEILPYFVWHRVRVVHLVRQNHLDVTLSYAVKAKLGRAHVLAGQSAPEDMRVELDTDNLVKRLEWLQTKQKIARTMLKLSGLHHLEVTYEDLLHDPSQFRRILDFLSVAPEAQLSQSSVTKIRTKGHHEVIGNYDRVKQVLGDSKFAALLE